MKYYLAEGRYYNTKADVKGKEAKQVDLPTDKDGYRELVNGLLDERDAANAAAILTNMHPLVIVPDPDTVRDQQRQDITIEEAIAEADYPRALALAHHIHHRLMEHARAAQPSA